MYAEEQDDWESFDTLRGHKSTVWSIAWEKDGDRLGVLLVLDSGFRLLVGL